LTNKKELEVSEEKIPKISDLIGKGITHISEMTHLEKDILVPKINEDICLKCGRCFLACADSGY